MSRLSELYAELLSVGFLVLRQAVDAHDNGWIRAEVEMLHNVPSLMDEENVERHRYSWLSERPAYIEWASAPGRETAKSRMRTFYEPVWSEMEPLLDELFRAQPAGEARA